MQKPKIKISFLFDFYYHTFNWVPIWSSLRQEAAIILIFIVFLKMGLKR
jgi:hypothetical protein